MGGKMAFSEQDLEAFHKTAGTLKLYRRAELENERGDSIIEALYVDPLPGDHIYNTILKPNTTFIIGRKGTGKSTIFQRAQAGLRSQPRVMSTYIDIKTVFERSQVDPSMTDRISEAQGALSVEEVEKLLLMRAFLTSVVTGLRDDMLKQLGSSSWVQRLRDRFQGTSTELFDSLNEFLDELEQARFVDIIGIAQTAVQRSETAATSTESGISASAKLSQDPSLSVDASKTKGGSESITTKSDFSEVLLRSLDIRGLVLRLSELLTPLDVRHLYVFVDDFSELPEDAMKTVVDVLLAPLNNWSDELVKFKVAAYPGRVYYGLIDKTKIDEVNLDPFHLYGGKNVAEMESKAIDFTRRLVEKRLQYFGTSFDAFHDGSSKEDLWRLMFFASMGNPRTLGYLLFFLYESQLLYNLPINATAIRDSAKRFYEEKVEPYFGMGRFLHESFHERSTIYSLKELLENMVQRARTLRSYKGSEHLRTTRGRPPTSHFHVPHEFDSLLSTLELNFFLTKYYVMSDRDGKRVSVYALNYGLCQKYTIEFGRPMGSRENRLYFVERIFDYTPIVQDYLSSHQEIKCEACQAVFANDQLASLRMYGMQCPTCGKGRCRVTNVSRKYQDILKAVDSEALLPQTELGILQTLGPGNDGMYAKDIAGELDCSYQLVGWRAKRLAERDLVRREVARGRRQYTSTDLARRIYMADDIVGELDMESDAQESSND